MAFDICNCSTRKMSNSRIILVFWAGLVSTVAMKNSLKFFAIGDWGGTPFRPYKTIVQLSVSEGMAYFSQNADFVISLGDNFYLNGVKNVDDSRFNETFEYVYRNSSLKIPWLVIAGNHDHLGNVSAQISYSKISERWTFPYYYYKKSFAIPSTNSVVDIVMIDTVLLCGSIDLLNPEKQPELLKTRKNLAEEQWEWLETTLKLSNATYLLLCGHYPVYSIGFHGNTDCLVQRLVPLLEKYRVSAYFSGHDHNLQHIHIPGGNWEVEYFVSGASGFVDDSRKHEGDLPSGSLMFHWGEFFSLGAFGYVEATAKMMTVSFVEADAKVLYTYSFSPRFSNSSS